jgi:hypothetical protein
MRSQPPAQGEKMPLNWNATKVANFKEGDEEWRENVAYFCFTLMAIGVSSVTEKNLGDIYTRIKILNALNGPLRYHYDEETKVKTPVYDFDFVKSMVGYSTNVSNETFLQWIKRFSKHRIEDNQNNFERAFTKDKALAEVE